MNFVLLGGDARVLPTIRAIAADPRHALSHAVAADGIRDGLQRLVPAVQTADDWMTLLMLPAADAVLVAGHDPPVLEGARRLAADGRTLVVFPDVRHGAAFLYELSLARDDSGARLLPALPLRRHPRLDSFRRSMAAGELGRVLHVQIDRTLPQQPPLGDGPAGSAAAGGASPSPRMPALSTLQADQALLPDLDVLRDLGGDYNQVTALHTAAGPELLAMATVTLAGDGLPQALWSLRAVEGEPTWRLTVTGERGAVEMSGPPPDAADGGDWRVAEHRAEALEREPASDATSAGVFDPGEAVVRQVEAAAAGARVSPDWTDLVRAFEILEACHRSLKRRRTIDLHFETASERGLFKSQMTAIGCGVLVVTLVALVALLAAGTLLDRRGPVEVAAARAEAIFERHDFVDQTARLTPEARRRAVEVAGRMRRGTFAALVEESAVDGELDDARRRRVAALLEEAGAPDADQRTVVGPVTGRPFQAAMRVARVLVFVPLFLYLLLQALVLIARPSRREV